MTDSNKLARIFKVLSVESRVRIVQLLKKRSLCVNALASVLGITPAAVSQHLRILCDAGLVKGHKQGQYVHYCLNDSNLAKIGDSVEKILKADNK
ncbi:MAG: transcriptional regulator [Planctomycetes bacterium RBG_13_44_8b]|nr:MAG: transcriptional regulator [Planctomycetes bacterium RBG_13_44_8b]